MIATSRTEGKTIEILGDQYLIIANFGEMLVLKRNNFFVLYFERGTTMIPCGKKKAFSRNIIESETSLTFMGVVFSKTGYKGTECGIREMTSLVSNTPICFSIEKDKLLKVV